MSFSIKRSKAISQQPEPENKEPSNPLSFFETDSKDFLNPKDTPKEQAPKILPGSEKGLGIRNGKMGMIDHM